MDFWRLVDNSEDYIKVIIEHPTVHFSLCSLYNVYILYLNIASYLYWKQIKLRFGTKLYLWMIFICVHFNPLALHECRTMILKDMFFKFRVIDGKYIIKI